MKVKIRTRNEWTTVVFYDREIEIPDNIEDIEGYIYDKELYFDDESYGKPLCNGQVLSSVKGKQYTESDDSFEIIK